MNTCTNESPHGQNKIIKQKTRNDNVSHLQHPHTYEAVAKYILLTSNHVPL